MSKRIEQGQATRQRLVAVATELFAERGYESTSIDAVLDQVEMSRGSLYHHFRNKQELFEAVLDAVEIRIGEATLGAAAAASSSAEALRAGCLAWVQLAADPVVRRIVLTDAPSVLGWSRWREIEEQHALGMLKAAMQAAAGEGRVRPDLADVYAHMLLATMNELAMIITRAEDRPLAQRTAEMAVDELLGRLLGPASREP
jgi:AcrR family transcriptional regulator